MEHILLFTAAGIGMFEDAINVYCGFGLATMVGEVFHFMLLGAFWVYGSDELAAGVEVEFYFGGGNGKYLIDKKSKNCLIKIFQIRRF